MSSISDLRVNFASLFGEKSLNRGSRFAIFKRRVSEFDNFSRDVSRSLSILVCYHFLEVVVPEVEILSFVGAMIFEPFRWYEKVAGGEEQFLRVPMLRI